MATPEQVEQLNYFATVAGAVEVIGPGGKFCIPTTKLDQYFRKGYKLLTPIPKADKPKVVVTPVAVAEQVDEPELAEYLIESQPDSDELDLESLPTKRLRRMAKELDLDNGGTKAELIDRIRDTEIVMRAEDTESGANS